MIKDLPIYITLLFGLTVIATLVWFYLASKSKIVLFILVGWTLLQSAIGLNGIYLYTDAMPPRIMLFGLLPTLLAIGILFITPIGKKFIDSLHLKTLTSFHTIRIPVELVLVYLYYEGAVSIYMTFEGTNFDIFSGVTAPIMALYAIQGDRMKVKRLLSWNFVCLALLLNVVITAIFAIPSPFQKLSLEQPNVAVLYFPFNLLPTVIVPLVLLAHLAAIRQLFSVIRKNKKNHPK